MNTRNLAIFGILALLLVVGIIGFSNGGFFNNGQVLGANETRSSSSSSSSSSTPSSSSSSFSSSSSSSSSSEDSNINPNIVPTV